VDERLEKIENKLSLAEDLLDELNKTIYRQQLDIERLQREVITLREQVRASLPDERRNLSDEIPPHY
jgi:SlyX protein